MKHRIYISGAISNDAEHKSKFAAAAQELAAQGFSVINPANLGQVLPTDAEHEEYMRVCMVLLDMCEYVYMLKGWEKSTGANREFGYAFAMDKIIMRE